MARANSNVYTIEMLERESIAGRRASRCRLRTAIAAGVVQEAVHRRTLPEETR